MPSGVATISYFSLSLVFIADEMKSSKLAIKQLSFLWSSCQVMIFFFFWASGMGCVAQCQSLPEGPNGGASLQQAPLCSQWETFQRHCAFLSQTLPEPESSVSTKFYCTNKCKFLGKLPDLVPSSLIRGLLSQFPYLRFAEYVPAMPHVECPSKGLCKNICEPPVWDISLMVLIPYWTANVISLGLVQNLVMWKLNWKEIMRKNLNHSLQVNSNSRPKRGCEQNQINQLTF